MKVEKLTTAHDRSTFRCGRDELDEWLLTAARQAGQRNRSVRTTVLVDDRAVVGSTSLAPVRSPSEPHRSNSCEVSHDMTPCPPFDGLGLPSTRIGKARGWVNGSWPAPCTRSSPPLSTSASC